MADKMELSLQDIIKQSKMGQIGGNNRDRRTSPGSLRKGGGPRSVVTRMPANGGGGNGGVMRDRNRGGINRNRSTGVFHRISDRKREAFLGPRTGGNFSDDDETTKLMVSNLNYAVTNCDILELFSEFGPLKRASVHYDRFDRSLGSAEVIFERSSDAIKALKQFNGLPLDGREMNIALAPSEMPSIKPARTAGFRSSRPGSNRPGAELSTNRRGRGPAYKPSAGNGRKSAEGKAAGGKAVRGKRAQKKVLTAEELDAELDEYRKNVIYASSSP